MILINHKQQHEKKKKKRKKRKRMDRVLTEVVVPRCYVKKLFLINVKTNS